VSASTRRNPSPASSSAARATTTARTDERPAKKAAAPAISAAQEAPAKRAAASKPAKAPAKSAVKAPAKPATKAPAKTTAKKAGAEPATAPSAGAPDDAAVDELANDDAVEVPPAELVADDAAVVEGEAAEDEGFVYSESDDADEPAQQVMQAGATADPVKDYLKQIGKVPLLNAEQEVELAKRIEAGLFAEEKLGRENKISAKMLDELTWIAEDGRRAK
jgi:RNA polymerase primary sigma factor